MKLLLICFTTLCLVSRAQAVAMNEAMRLCWTEYKTICPNLGHDSVMLKCFNLHFAGLSSGCQTIVVRLNRGEKLTLF